MRPHSLQQGATVDGVERVLEIDFEEQASPGSSIALSPLASGVDGSFAAPRSRDSRLERPEERSRVLAEDFAQRLADQSPQSFTDSNRASTATLLGESEQGGPC